MISYFQCVLVLALVVPGSADAQEVFLRSGPEQGRGLSRTLDKECFVITPRHVINPGVPTSVTFDNGASSNARVVREFEEDIVILQVEKDNAVRCTKWPKPSNNQDLLARPNQQGELVTRQSNGSLSRMRVQIVRFDDRFVLVRPWSINDAVVRGMSGSTFYVREKLIGMVGTVATDSSRDAKIYRLEYVSGLIGTFFERQALDQLHSEEDSLAALAALADLSGEWESFGEEVRVRTLNDSVLVGEYYPGTAWQKLSPFEAKEGQQVFLLVGRPGSLRREESGWFVEYRATLFFYDGSWPETGSCATEAQGGFIARISYTRRERAIRLVDVPHSTLEKDSFDNVCRRDRSFARHDIEFSRENRQ